MEFDRDYYTVTQLAKALDVHKFTVPRWITKGVRVGKRTVKLGARKVGGRWRIYPDDVTEFEQATNPQRRREARKIEARQKADAIRRHERAKQYLRFMGILPKNEAEGIRHPPCSRTVAAGKA